MTSILSSLYRRFYWARLYLGAGVFATAFACVDYIATRTSYDVVVVETVEIARERGGAAGFAKARTQNQIVRARLDDEIILVRVRQRRNYVEANAQACLRTDSPGIWGGVQHRIVDVAFCTAS